MNAFVESKGWYDSNSKRAQTPRNLAISLVLEASEVLELFQWHEAIESKKALSHELADVARYLFQLASITGIDLEDAIVNKLEINSKREWDQ